MRIARYVIRVTNNTLGICNTYSFPTATMATRTRLNITFVLDVSLMVHHELTIY